MYTEQGLLIGKGKSPNYLLPSMANRHGFIAGATGTGKTVTLKVMAESFSDAGVPVVFADVKGDLSGTIHAGALNEKITERLKELNIENFTFAGYPCEFWDVLGETGLSVRATISEIGPLLLARLLDLNDTQSSLLQIVFKIADDQGLLLLDYKDLRELVRYISTNASEFKETYGLLSTTSLSSILRKIIAFEEEGADDFFGEEALDIEDLMRYDDKGRGVINILNAQKLFQKPKIYSTFLLWFMAELYERLPEVGDVEKPKIVFFFDEAHLLFNNIPKALLEKIEQVVRLIRSKGVGIYFVTQNPTDIPDVILGQLGNRVQHALRSYSAKDQANIKATAKSFRTDGTIDIEKEITSLKVGQALISLLDEEGRPTIADISTILPPSSSLKPASPQDIQEVVDKSFLKVKYLKRIDRQSAYELLQEKIQNQTAQEIERAKKETLRPSQESQKTQSTRRTTTRRKSTFEKMTQSMVNTVGRQIGRELIRGIFGALKK